jgi:hypothetical protein
MISHQYKCIFIHIPKTAGTSIEQKLGHFKELQKGVQDHRSISQIEPVTIGELVRACIKFDSNLFLLLLKKMIRDKQFNNRHCYNNYFKFSFVRNPWARVFSWYKNVMRDNHHKKRFGVADDCSFKDFLNKHMDQWELKTQLYWLIDKKGDMPLDFIGRFENLNDDFGYVAEKVGLEDKALPKLISGDGVRYVQFYDDEMIDIINKIYKDEIMCFGFEYGQ